MRKPSPLSEAGEAADRTLGDGPVGQTTRGCADARNEQLTWIEHDHHFAPGPEALRSVYQCAGSSAKLTVTITDRADVPVYRREVSGTDGRHDFEWDGRGNRGAWENRLITPLESPYKVRIARDASLSDEFELHVFYHSVRIGLGDWIDGPEPNPDAEPARWVQYKLNTLGYFAGPVDGVVGEQTKRALRRYARATSTLDPDSVVQPDFHRTPELCEALAANAHARDVLPGGLPAEGAAPARLYLDHNVFEEESMGFVIRMSAAEPKELDRPELPLEATILLVGRDDADGSGEGVVAPHAVGPVSIEWQVYDGPEDTERLEATNPTTCPTRRRACIEQILQQTRARDGSDNCPITLGGARNTEGYVNPGYFRIGDQLPPFISETARESVWSTAHDGDGDKRGKAGILFRASYIGGDDYRIEARLSFAGRANEDALIDAHQAQLAGDWAERRRVSTGKLVVWRRVSVAAVIHWPGIDRDIDWPGVIEEFEHAYIELSRPQRTMTGDEFLTDILAAAPEKDRKNFARDMGLRIGLGPPMNFRGDALFETFKIPVQEAKEQANNYKKRVDQAVHHTLASGRTPPLYLYSRYMAGFFKQQGLVGAILIIGKWLPSVEVKHPRGKAPDDLNATRHDPEIISIGLSHGVAVITQTMFARYGDRFVVAHEIGHTRGLTHHEVGRPEDNPAFDPKRSPSAHPEDHDPEDHNCTMSYPEHIPSRNKAKKTPLEWSPTSATQSAFCGKCLLRLRGWKIEDLDTHGNR